MKDSSALWDSSAACTGGNGKLVEVFRLGFSGFFFVGGGRGHEDKQFEIEKEGCLKCSDRDLWVLLVALVTNCWLTYK